MNEHDEVANIVADAMEVFIKNNFHKPITNYDRIKSMSVEDLTEFINNISTSLAVKMNGEYIVREKDSIKQWLLQEVSEAEQEDRTNALKYLAKLDGAKIKMIVASMCEVYVNLEAGKISKDEAKGIMALIEKDLEEGVKND